MVHARSPSSTARLLTTRAAGYRNELSRSLLLPLRNGLINHGLINKSLISGPLSETLDCGLTCGAGIRRFPCRECDPCQERRLPCREWVDSVVGLRLAHDFLPTDYTKMLWPVE